MIVPVYQAENYAKTLISRIHTTQKYLSTCNIDLTQVVFVCDEPIDKSIECINQIINESDSNNLEMIELSSNVGQHLATAAGILTARGDWIITLDEDLQHPPELIPKMLEIACSRSYDIVYCTYTKNQISHNIYRSATSKVAKKIISWLSGVNLEKISSFRCIRSSLARSSANSMDKFQYFDVLLQFLSSPKRIGYLREPIKDNRFEKSGYSLFKLVGHFNRLIISSLVSGRRLFILTLFPLLFISLGSTIVIFNAFQADATQLSPGWTSLFTISSINLIAILLAFSLLAKCISIVLFRSIAPPSYLVMNRDRDKSDYQRLVQMAKSNG